MALFGILVWAIIAVGVQLLSDLLRPKPDDERNRQSGLGDLRFPSVSQSRKINLVVGRVEISGVQLAWWGHYAQKAIKDKIKTGMFSSQRVLIGFRYYVGLQLILCRGGAGITLHRIRWGKNVLYESDHSSSAEIAIDEPRFLGGDSEGTGGLAGVIEFYNGAQTAASAYLARFQAISGVTSAYLGNAYLVLRGPGSAATSTGFYVGNSQSIEQPYIEVSRYPSGVTGLSLQVGDEANLMHALYELLTDDEWGYKIPSSLIDITALKNVGNVLKDEGNGISFLHDREIDRREYLSEIERQADGRLYLDLSSGKFSFKLARDDYDIDTVPQITDSDIVSIEAHRVGTWSDTINQVLVKFNDRTNDYVEGVAASHDGANAEMQGGGTPATARLAPSTLSFPGVFDAANANAIALRELRALSIPPIATTLVLRRAFSGLILAEAVALTSTHLNLNKQPMRVSSVELMEGGQVRVALVRDTFQFAAGLYGDPPATEWSPPADDLDAFPADEQLAFEAPRGFLQRDPDSTSEPLCKVWCTGRAQGPETLFRIRERHAAGTPSGTFSEAGDSYGFVLMGELSADLAPGDSAPDTFEIVPTPDSQSDILDELPDRTPEELEASLFNLLLVGDEFLLVASASASGANVAVSAYRGVLDSVQGYHTAGAPVYVLEAGGALTETVFNGTDNVDLKLLPATTSDEVLESAATTIAVNLDRRSERPLPPSRPSLNGTAWNGTPSLEGSGSGLDGVGIALALVRRDYRSTLEIQGLTIDAATLDPTFPAANATVYTVEVIDDPLGTPSSLFTTAEDDPPFLLSRLDILRATNGSLPTSLGIEVLAYHDTAGDHLASRSALVFDFAPTSSLTGQFEFGALDTNVSSAAYTAAATGTFTLNIGTAFSAGNVQVNVNGGGFTNVITAGNTTGTFSATSGDSIVVRHTSTDTDALTFLELRNPSNVAVAFSVLYT